MTRQIVLLRGVNLAARNRVAMKELRELLSGEGFESVRTYLQSGNVVLDGDTPPAGLAAECERLIAARLGLDIQVVVRTRDELAEIVRRNPLAAVAADPKRYQVTFLADEPSAEAVGRLHEAVHEPERLTVIGRELYAWHPAGVAGSRLSRLLAGPGLGTTATARNWRTVMSLLEMADE